MRVGFVHEKGWRIVAEFTYLITRSQVLKSDSHLPKRLVSFVSMKALLKIIKNSFYFILKHFSFSRYLNFCLDLLVKQKNSLIRKLRLISKFFTSRPVVIITQTITIHTLSNMSLSKATRQEIWTFIGIYSKINSTNFGLFFQRYAQF